MISKLVDFVQNFSYEQMPDNVRQAARTAILDYIGVTVAGSRGRAGKAITRYVKESGGAPDSTVICGGFKTSPYLAALANGTMGHALDYDDECESWNSHPTVAVLPAVLALGEKLHLSGKEMMTAYVMGWEVAAALGHNIYFKITERGYHATGVMGAISGTAASAHILKLNPDQIRMAFGIAGSQAAGLLDNFGTDTKPFHGGLGASTGLRSAQLAALGFTANPDTLENPKGFFWAAAGVELKEDLSKLGVDFDIVKSMCIKAYPCCYCNQRPLDSAFYLRKKYNIKPEEIAEVEVKEYPLQMKTMPYGRPQNELQAKFSIQFSMATAFVYGKATLEEYEDEKVLDPRIQDFMKKVKQVPVEGKTLADYTHCAPGQMVTVRLKNGKEYSYDSGHPRGHSTNPMEWDEVAAKFKVSVGKSLTAQNTEKVADLVKNFADIKDGADLMSLLAGKATR